MLQDNERMLPKKLKTSKFKNISVQVEEIRCVVTGIDMSENEIPKHHLKYPPRNTVPGSRRYKDPPGGEG